MEDEICMSCKKDNGVNSHSHCKYCSKPLCKKSWCYKHTVNTPLVVNISTKIDQFKHCEIKKQNSNNLSYKFSCYKTVIDFDKEVIKFFVEELKKPLIVHFLDVDKMIKAAHPNFNHYCSLSLKLLNNVKIDIARNNININVFDVLDKFLETTYIIKNVDKTNNVNNLISV